MFLTKSDFKLACDCPTKLFYKKKKYPSLLEENPYLAFLADGGYMVETIAKLLYPDGKDVGSWDQPEQAFEESRAALEAGERVVLFEPTIIHGKYLVRVDILERFRNVLRLIEVKSASLDSEGDGPDFFRGARGGITSRWRVYLEDVAFQTLVLQQAFPEFEIHPFLCLVDKATVATDNLTLDQFTLVRSEDSWAPEVRFLGDVARLQDEHLLRVCDVRDEVNELLPDIRSAAADFAESIDGDSISKIPPEIGQKCKGCEFRTEADSDAPSGFGECWGRLADPDPHVLDLIRIDLAGGRNRDVAAELASEGKADLLDIPDEVLTGLTGDRQRFQLACHRDGAEVIPPDLSSLLSGHAHPLHFIDFEGSRLAIPYHVGMHPYEQAGFQWSCHTLDEDGSLDHNEWLNAEDAFPNFAFARSLREQIGDEGTVYIWSSYEITMLRDIRRQLNDYSEDDDSLKAWLDRMIANADGRIVDLWTLAKQHYYHPSMKGSYSIKDVLPAAWNENEAVRQIPEFAEYVEHDAEGKLLDPYEALPPLPIGETEEIVKEGTGAMRVYQDMMFGTSGLDPRIRGNYRALLLQYCKLDTAAMVIIWKHWTSHSAEMSRNRSRNQSSSSTQDEGMEDEWREEKGAPLRLYDQNVLYPLLRKAGFGEALLASATVSLREHPDSERRVLSLVSTVLESLGVLPNHPESDPDLKKSNDGYREVLDQVTAFADIYYRGEAKRLLGLLGLAVQDKRSHCLESRLEIFEACLGSFANPDFEDTLRFHLLHDYVTKFRYSRKIEDQIYNFLADQCFIMSQKVGRNASSFRLVKRIWDSSYPFYSRQDISDDARKDLEACNGLMRLKERRDFLDCDIVHLAVFGVFDREVKERYPVHAFTKDGVEDVKLRIRLLKGVAESRRQFAVSENGAEIPDDLVSRMNGLVLFVGDDGSIYETLDVAKDCEPLIVVR